MVWPESGEKSAQIKHRLQVKTALNKYVAGFRCERQQEMDFSLEEALLWTFLVNFLRPIHTTSDKATQSHSFQWRAGDFWRQARHRPLATRWGVSSDTTKFRILQLYANEERLSGATANRKEDGWAHVIVLLSGIDKHTLFLIHFCLYLWT